MNSPPNCSANSRGPINLAKAADRYFKLSLDLHVVSSRDGFFKYVSDSVTEILGWSVEEFLARPYIDWVHADDREATLAEVEKQMGTGQKVLNFENRYVHRDGSWRILSWRSMPSEGLMYATARDVTESKHIEAGIVKARAALEVANSELEAFSYSVAHDLRSPLRAITGFSNELALEFDGNLSEKGARYLGLIRKSAGTMAALIDDMLEFSRVSQYQMARETIDLSAVVLAAHRKLQHGDPQRRVELAVHGGLTCEGDARLLPVMVDNLLGNAWKYSSRQPEARIEFGVTDSVTSREFFIRDNGAGFDMKYAHKLFGVFERLHDVAEFEGTGVGLATVRRIIERHGGKIRAEGAIGKGATFYFTLGATAS